MSPAGRALALVAGDLSLVRALGRGGIPVACAVQDAHSPLRLSRYCRETVSTPGWVEAPDAALDAVLAWAKTKTEAPVFFYQGDHDLMAVSRGRDRLGSSLRCVLPPSGLVEDLGDKMKFAALSARLNLPVPATR